MILVEEGEMTFNNPDTDTTRSQTVEAEAVATRAEIEKGTTIQAEVTDKEIVEDTKTTTEGKHEIRFTSFAQIRQIN